MLLVSACLAIPLVLMSCYRVACFGWQPILAFHLGTLALLWTSYCWRRAIPLRCRAYGLIGLILLLGCLGLWNYGLLSAGLLFFIAGILLTTLLFGIRAGLGVLLGCLMVLVSIAVGLARHWIHFALDPATLAAAPQIWLAFIVVIGSLMGGMVIVVGRQHQLLLAELKSSQQHAVQLQQAEEQLRHKQIFLDEVIDLLPIPLAILDTSEEIMQTNQALRLEMERRHVSSKTQVMLLDPRTAQPILEQDQPAARALRGEQVAAEEYLLAVSSHGGAIPCLISAAPIRAHGEITAVVYLLEDITAQKEEGRAKDEFLAVLAHELQTPLTSILGWSELALATNSLHFFQRAMAVVHRNAERQKSLVADILDTSRLLHRKTELTLVNTDLREQLEQAVENIQYDATQKGLTLQCDTPTDHLSVQVDLARFQQCLDNLLRNSLNFTPSGGIITASARQQGQDARLTISDSGRGIAPEMLPLIFEPFRQIDRNELHGGLGLGLAITRGIVELHGGRIWAESEGEDRGCSFTIVLPLMCEE